MSNAGHPKGLYVCFGAEMFERLCYYGMRGLLKAYMVYYLCSGFAAHLYPTDSPPVPTISPARSTTRNAPPPAT